MKRIIVILLVALATSSAIAHDEARVEALEQRVQQLEKQIVALTASMAPVVAQATAEQRVQGQRVLARERMGRDSSVYSPEELREIEALYQVANQKWQSQEGKESLKQLIEKFGKANRTGCALLYLGQMSEGKEREEYLQRAIDGFSDCCYGDGVQVGAYARYYLAYHYKEKGQVDQADALFKEILRTYPDAIDHKGRLLSDSIDQ